jgi:hypothetical protein
MAKPAGSNSAATITASFTDTCRDFSAHSTKDISHVEIHYVDGRVVKDETINRPDFSIDGGPGGEIAFAVVKSGTTSVRFDCTPPATNSPPTALLEILTPETGPTGCALFFESGLECVQTVTRSVWRDSSEFPTEPGAFGTEEAGHLLWGCPSGSAGWTSGTCSMTFDFRGTNSSDADSDIASWSMDFGDGTSATGSWSANPPLDVTHSYALDVFGGTQCGSHCVITLTVTDSAGHTDTDTITMGFLDESPD